MDLSEKSSQCPLSEGLKLFIKAMLRLLALTLWFGTARVTNREGWRGDVLLGADLAVTMWTAACSPMRSGQQARS
jgi:hypothetical protein